MRSIGKWALFYLLLSSILTCRISKPIETIDLIDYFEHFPVSAQRSVILFDQTAFFSTAVSGWNMPVKQNKNNPNFYTTGPQAQLQVLFAEPQDYEMKYVCQSNAEYELIIELNGHSLSSQHLTKGRNVHHATLPESKVRTGFNQLAFAISPSSELNVNKPRISFRRIEFNSESPESDSELNVLPKEKRVDLTGTVYSTFYIRTGRQSRIRFHYRSEGMMHANNRLTLRIENAYRQFRIRELDTRASDWKEAIIDLSDFDHQVVKISFFQLAPSSMITQIIHPTLERHPRTTRDNHKILLIGLDGADWNVLKPLLRAGRLPNIQKLMENGTSAPLRSLKPMYSPVIWTTIITGKSMKQHGIKGFVQQRREKGRIIPNSRLNRRCLALWNILSAQGFVVGIVGPWVSWPAENVNGYILSDRMYFENLPATTHPRELKSSIFLKYEPHVHQTPTSEYTTLSQLLKPKDLELRSTIAENVRNLNLYIEQDELKHLAGLHLSETLQPDFTFLYMRGPDVSGHFFWKYHEPDENVPEEEVNAFRDVITQNYIYQDHVIGNFLKLHGEDTTTIIVSDHGMGKIGYQPRFDFHGLDVLLDKIQLSVNPTDIRKHRYGVDLTFQKGIDLKGAATDLQAIHLGQGSRALFKILPSEQSDTLSLETNLFPRIDSKLELIYKGSNLGSLMDFASLEEISGDHQLFGILIMNGKGVRKNTWLESSSVLDITPTILHLLGLPVGRDMEGQVLTEALVPRFMQKNPIGFLSSYESSLQELPQARSPKADPQLESELIERLRSLGYLK